MAGFPKRRNRVWWITVGLAVLIGSAAGLRWWASRGVGPVSAGLRAYEQGDWDLSARLALRRLKAAPGDWETLRLAARAMARQDRDRPAIAAYSRLEPKWTTAEDDFLLGRAPEPIQTG